MPRGTHATVSAEPARCGRYLPIDAALETRRCANTKTHAAHIDPSEQTE
jgi:hypothetical protein